MKIDFEKFEGAGNDFVIVDARNNGFDPRPGVVAALCDRRFGIGADGLMLLQRDEALQFRMRYFNSDGPEATMCGNGGRCIALFAFLAGIAGDDMDFVAVDGCHSASALSTDGESGVVKLGMSDTSAISELAGGYFINTGSPHWVGFVDDVASVDVFNEGRRMRLLPEIEALGGANFNFVELLGEGKIKVRTYERGVEDETLACGTGAVASAAVTAAVCCPACRLFDVAVVGGKLSVSFKCDGGVYRNVQLTGPARRVYSGTFETDNFGGI